MLLSVGNTIDDRYEIIKPLASGGFAVVYKAHQKDFDRTVAIKVLEQYALTEPDSLPRFELEAKAVSALRHKNIVGLYGFGIWRNAPYMVLEFVDGTSLQDLIRKHGKLTPARATAIAAQVCEALELAHGNGIVHRDLKPSNVMITASPDGGELVKIIDFGLAKLMPGFGLPAQKLTETGAALGTCTYMPPEQCTGHTVDHRADLYSLGCILYECLAGEPPFVADNNVGVMFMHLNNYHASIDDTKGKDPQKRRLDAIINKALAKEPAQRYSSAREMLGDLQAVLAGNEPPIAKDASRPQQQSSGTAQKQNKKGFIAILSGAGVIALGLACAAYFNAHSSSSRDSDLPKQSSLDLYRITYNNARSWDPKQGHRESLALQTLAENNIDHKLDARKLMDVYSILTAEEQKKKNWTQAYLYNEKAIEYCKRNDPNDPGGYTHLLCKADCLYNLNHKEESLMVYHQVLDAPEGRYDQCSRGHTYFQLAGIEQNENNIDEAIADMKKATAPSHDTSLMLGSRVNLARLFMENGQPQLAEPWLKEAMTLPGEPPYAGEISEYLLRSLILQGRWADAQAAMLNMSQGQYRVPHEFNALVLATAVHAHNRERASVEQAVDSLTTGRSLSFDDHHGLNVMDKDVALAQLKLAGYNDLIERLYASYPDWKWSEK